MHTTNQYAGYSRISIWIIYSWELFSHLYLKKFLRHNLLNLFNTLIIFNFVIYIKILNKNSQKINLNLRERE